ncbi:MAG: hypothetical protein ACRD52_15285 [Candidatus Acidiferrales bacterium]
MREKNFHCGLRGVLFEARHYARMGSAVWLYGWLVLRQTHQTGAVGWVLGGAPVCYREIEEETGFNRRTLERWMCALRREGYIETESTPGGVVVRITKAKKYAQPGRGFAEGARKNAWGRPRNRGADAAESYENAKDAEGISSKSVERRKENINPSGLVEKKIHNPQETGIGGGIRQEENPAAGMPNPSRENANRNASAQGNSSEREVQAANPREYRNSWPKREAYSPSGGNSWAEAKVLREELVRRELGVGAGPEIPRRWP